MEHDTLRSKQQTPLWRGLLLVGTRSMQLTAAINIFSVCARFWKAGTNNWRQNLLCYLLTLILPTFHDEVFLALDLMQLAGVLLSVAIPLLQAFF